MHRTALTGTERRTRRADSRTLRSGTLKNWLTRNRTAGRRTHGPGGTRGRTRGRRPWRRSFIDRTRAGLRHDHSRCGRLRGSSSDRGRSWARRCGRSGRYGSSRRGRSRRRNHRRRRRRRGHWAGRRHWSRSGRRRRLLNRRRNRRRPCGRRRRGGRNCGNRRRSRRRRRGSSGRGRRNRRFGGNGRRCGAGRRGRSRFLLLRNSLQHVSGAGDMRQIDLGLDFFFAAQWTRGTRRGRLCFRRAADVGSDFFCFVVLD